MSPVRRATFGVLMTEVLRTHGSVSGRLELANDRSDRPSPGVVQLLSRTSLRRGYDVPARDLEARWVLVPRLQDLQQANAERFDLAQALEDGETRHGHRMFPQFPIEVRAR